MDTQEMDTQEMDGRMNPSQGILRDINHSTWCYSQKMLLEDVNLSLLARWNDIILSKTYFHGGTRSESQ